MNDMNTRTRKLLGNWIAAVRPDLRKVPGKPEYLYYGDGTNGWGVQTNQKAFSAFAAYAKMSGDRRAQQEALAMLRFSLATHVTGDQSLTDGDGVRWGHTWISILGIERMMFGVEALSSSTNMDALTDADRAALKRVLLSEADYQLTQEIIAGIPGAINKPESNWWNGGLLLRCALFYPDAPNAAAYREKAADLLANAISVPSDAESEELLDGKPMCERFIGANFTEVYALNHHGYLNVGYMVITLSQAAYLHFSLRDAGLTAPEWMYRHVRELWKLVKSLIFPDGRLCRIGGDTRVRYCYCQDYLLPVLLMVEELFGESTGALRKGWLSQVEREVSYNGDGTFLSKRVELFRERSVIYYTRLESDRATTLACTAYYDRGMSPRESRPVKPIADWHDAYHGACFTRNDCRIASFSWSGAEGPVGLCVPLADSSLAEWRNNLVGRVEGDGTRRKIDVLTHRETSFPGGFLTSGEFMTHEYALLTEQLSEENVVHGYMAYAALPDGATVLVIQIGRIDQMRHCVTVTPLLLNIPNDVFNGFSRTYEWSDDRRCVTVDNKLSVLSLCEAPLELLNPPYRQIGLCNHSEKFAPYAKRGMLHCDELTIAPQRMPRFYESGETVYDIAAAVTIGTFASPASAAYLRDGNIHAAAVRGQDGVGYVLAYNPGMDATETTLQVYGQTLTLKLDAGEAKLAKV